MKTPTGSGSWCVPAFCNYASFSERGWCTAPVLSCVLIKETLPECTGSQRKNGKDSLKFKNAEQEEVN